MRSPEEHAAGTAIIHLMRGVVYRESDEDAWLALTRHIAAVRDHFATVGVDVVISDAEGYAYLAGHEPEEGEEALPRLVHRRALSYNLSLLLVLLRKRLAEFEASGAEGKLVLTREQILDMFQLFMPDSTNQVRVINQLDATVNKARELGFLRSLRGQSGQWEVRRILKAYVDAQTLSDFAGKLDEYARARQPSQGDDDE